MNIIDFYTHPAGKGATFLNLKKIKKDFDARYESILPKILIDAFVDNKKTYAHIRIPSSVEGILYDIVVAFRPSQKAIQGQLKDLDIELFSNSPSFIYTYAHSYIVKGMFVRELKRKYSSEIIKKASEVRNPYGVISYDFSIYAAVKFLIVNNFLTVDSLKTINTYKSFNQLYKTVADAEDLQKARKTQKDFNRMVEKQEKENKLKYSNVTKQNQENNPHKAVDEVKFAKNAKSVSGVKKVKKGKRI